MEIVVRHSQFRMHWCKNPNNIIVGCDDHYEINDHIKGCIRIITDKNDIVITRSTRIYFIIVDSDSSDVEKMFRFKITSPTCYSIKEVDLKHIENYSWYDDLSSDLIKAISNELNNNKCDYVCTSSEMCHSFSRNLEFFKCAEDNVYACVNFESGRIINMNHIVYKFINRYHINENTILYIGLYDIEDRYYTPKVYKISNIESRCLYLQEECKDPDILEMMFKETGFKNYSKLLLNGVTMYNKNIHK
jgi:hypothetical protein|nr:MAG TPA: hypothetical protein [Caudoviricetes sp.]